MANATNVAKQFLWEILYVMSASGKIKPSVKNSKKKQFFASLFFIHLFNFKRMDLIVVQCDVPW